MVAIGNIDAREGFASNGNTRGYAVASDEKGIGRPKEGC